jgi:hypothetical protein
LSFLTFSSYLFLYRRFTISHRKHRVTCLSALSSVLIRYPTSLHSRPTRRAYTSPPQSNSISSRDRRAHARVSQIPSLFPISHPNYLSSISIIIITTTTHIPKLPDQTPPNSPCLTSPNPSPINPFGLSYFCGMSRITHAETGSFAPARLAPRAIVTFYQPFTWVMSSALGTLRRHMRVSNMILFLKEGAGALTHGDCGG